MAVNVSVVGASGYTGAELVRCLLKHPSVNLQHLAVRRDPLPKFSDLFPAFKGQVDQYCFPMDAQKIIEDSDVIFFALPHKTTMDILPEYMNSGKLLIDLSGDYRIKNPDVYEEFYGAVHKDVGNLEQFVYGLSEVNTVDIQNATCVANPGCFPTGVQLALYPFLKEGLIASEHIIVDAKTGISGGGKTPHEAFHFPECNESFKAYKVGVHQHEPEMEQGLSDAVQQHVDLLFVAHLAPMNRGIFSTMYAQLKQEMSQQDIYDVLQKFYADKPFVRIMEPGVSPEIKHVVHTNYCDIGFVAVGQTLVLMAAIDNLVKGAAGQAIQNMNLALGFPETAGLV